MRRDLEYLVFRNTLYKKIARSSPQLRPEASQQVGLNSHFYPLDESSLGFISDVEYREIFCSAYNGAVVAMNARSYRLALVGFGAALETMLVDWLAQKPPAIVASARVQSGAQFHSRYEMLSDPRTWRLVNLMRVARHLNGVRGLLDLPEPLRQLRNFVHPAVMKQSYLTEPNLRHEAIAAGGLVGAVMRDVQIP
jgi:hypothetical protein